MALENEIMGGNEAYRSKKRKFAGISNQNAVSQPIGTKLLRLNNELA